MTGEPHARALAGLCAIGLLAASYLAKAEPTGWEWRQIEGRSLALVAAADGRELCRLNFDPAQPHPYFDPVRTPGGADLTWVGPKDHPWHTGLWFSWKLINRVNYWEFEKGGTMPVGRTVIEKAEVLETAPTHALVAIELSLRPSVDAPPVARESVRIRIGVPGEGGIYFIDWHQTTEAMADVEFGRSSGYGGLSFRSSGEWTKPRILDSEGRIGLKATHLQRARWLDYSGVSAGRPCGLAMLDHPANPRHPTHWFVVDKMMATESPAPWPFYYSNAALLGEEPLRRAAGQKLELRYRVVVHPGPGDPAALEKAFADFTSSPAPDKPGR